MAKAIGHLLLVIAMGILIWFTVTLAVNSKIVESDWHLPCPTGTAPGACAHDLQIPARP